MKKFAFIWAALLLLAVSCQKDKVLIYNNITFVNAVGGVYTTDYGLVFNIVENTSEREIPADGRLILQCDVLKASGVGAYDVRVTNFAVPLTKDPIPAVDAPEADDPINIETGWFSGGYFNTLLGLYSKDKSEVKHIINAEYTRPTETNDTLYIRIRHNAMGELPADPDDTEDDYSYVHTYACFHLVGLLPSDTEVPTKILWKWYGEKGEGGEVTFEEYHHKIDKLIF